MKNVGGNGGQFLRRYFPISVTVGWKFVVVMFGTLWLVSTTLRGQSQELIGWCSTIALTIINILMFWRIGYHIGLLAKEFDGESNIN